MEQAQELARILHQACREINNAIPRLRTFGDIRHFTVEINRLENDGDRERARGARVAVRARDRPDDGHPLEGHLRAPRGGHRRHGASGQHPRGHHHQEHARRVHWTSSSGSSSRRRSRSTSRTASTTPPTRSPRRSRPARCRRASRSRMSAALNFVGAFLSLAGGGHDRHGHRRRRRDHAGDRVRRADRRDRLEPRDLVLRACPSSSSHALIGGIVGSAFVADGRQRGQRRRASWRRSSCPALIAPVARAARGRRWRSRSPTGSSAASAPGPGHARRSGSGSSSPAACSRSRTARTTRRRRWASSSWRWSRTGTSHVDRRPDLGRRLPRRPRSPLGTYVGGWRIIRTMGSRIIKMDPAQGFAAQGAGAAVILSASHVGFPLSTTHVISGGDHGRRRRQAALGGALGRRGQHRRRLGAHAAGVRGRRAR